MNIKNFGVDISKWQKGFDFPRAKRDGVKFIMLRAMYHMTVDAQFENFYKEAKKNNIPVGAYIYTTAKNEAMVVAEAKALCRVLKEKEFEYPIYLDIEDIIHKGQTRRVNTNIVKAFCEYMESQGYYVGVYSFLSFFQNNLFNEELDRFTRWVALWDKQDYCKFAHDIWQFGGETNKLKCRKVSNIAIVDQNYCYKDFPSIMKSKGLNGFEKLTPCKSFKY